MFARMLRRRRILAHGLRSRRWHNGSHAAVLSSASSLRRVSRRAALAALHVAVALFGFAALFGKWVALPATAIVLARTILGAATLVAVARLRNVPLRRGDRHLLVNGAILAAHWVAFFAAVQAGGVAIALLGYAVFPVFVMALEHRLGDRRSGVRGWASALLATLGLVALVPDLAW